ncbi:hypothetical protein MHBO_002406, partial [Bonamia ostreae]
FRPTVMQILPRITKITKIENIEISEKDLLALIGRADCDLRNILNCLEFWSSGENQNSAKNKDSSIGTWDAAAALFKPKNTGSAQFFEERSRYYFVDQMMVPLLIQENYLQHKLFGKNSFEKYVETSQILADSDLINKTIYSGQSFGLLPLHALLSCVIPAERVSGGQKPFRLQFPQWLGKNSNRNKNYRLCAAALRRIGKKMRCLNAKKFVADCSGALIRYISEPMIEKGKEGVEESIRRLVGYDLNKDDFDFMVANGAYENDKIVIETKAKSAFTRKFNSLNKTEILLMSEKTRKRKQPERTTKKLTKEGYEDDGFIVSSEIEESEDSFEIKSSRKRKTAVKKGKRSQKNGSKRRKPKSKKS